MRNAHQLEDIDTLRNQIADIEPDQNVKNFMAMMQAMSEEKLSVLDLSFSVIKEEMSCYQEICLRFSLYPNQSYMVY